MSTHPWWPRPCPNDACEHGDYHHDIDSYEDPKPMCVFEECPCGKPSPAEQVDTEGAPA